MTDQDNSYVNARAKCCEGQLRGRRGCRLGLLEGVSAWLTVVLCVVFFTARASASSRSKTDVVYMTNGDKITCEIRSLEQGQLTIKPDYTSSTIVLDWNKVDHVESSQLFFVFDPNGTQLTGTLGGEPGSRSLEVETTSPVTIPFDTVVEIEPLGKTFLRQLRGSIDVGTSFALSNQQKNLNLQGSVTYQTEKHTVSVDANSQFTSQQETSDTNETTGKVAYFREMKRSNWYGVGNANFLSSSAQKVDLRTTLGLGVAKRLIFTNKTNLIAQGGFGYTIENDAEGTTSNVRSSSLDGAFAVNYSTFRFDSTTLDTSLWVFPSITTPGRVRMTLNQDVYYKFAGDFYVKLSFYDNFDNKPVVGAPENNVGGATTIGWSFH